MCLGFAQVWYHVCPNRGKGCYNTKLKENGGCTIWYQEKEVRTHSIHLHDIKKIWTILIRAQASKAQGPIDFLRIIIFLFIYLFIYFLFNHLGTFGGLNMLKNSWKFAHTLESVGVRTPQRLGPGRGTGALRRPLEHSLKTWCIAHTYLHVFI